jgi:hypothetical protein
MSFWARLFGTDPASRLRKAEKAIARKAWFEAWEELDGLEVAEAAPLREAAARGLVVLNLAEAEARLRSGDGRGAQESLDLARQFGATDSDFHAVRRAAREVRVQAEKDARAAAAAAAAQTEGDDPLWSLPPDDPRLRVAVLLEAWPEALRARLAALGPDFAAAMVLAEDGQLEAALTGYGAFIEAEPAVRAERARVALLLGQGGLAIGDLQAFGDAVGHQRIGPAHTAVTLARLLAEAGRVPDALGVLDAHRGPLDVDGTRASLLEASGAFAEAEKAAVALLQQAPKDQGLYKLLARVRLRTGDRGGAVAALEADLACACGSPGKCGSQPYDVEAARMLARVYLEDRAEPDRAATLLGEIARHAEAPDWQDAYLQALAARNAGDPAVLGQAAALRAGLRAGDPRHRLLEAAFGPALPAA